MKHPKALPQKRNSRWRWGPAPPHPPAVRPPAHPPTRPQVMQAAAAEETLVLHTLQGPPTRERLAIKQRQAAQLYYRQGYLKAARITYEFLLREYPETSQHCVGLKALGDVERREGNPEKARFYWELAISDCTDEALLRDIHIWLSELEDGG